jgi:uncharacterized protein
VITLIVTSPSSGAGKTAVCAGIAKRLQEQGKKVGYIRTVIGTLSINSDAHFMKEILSIPDSVESMCPSFNDEQMLSGKIKSAVDAVSSDKDVIIVENQTASFAKILNARVLSIVTYTEYSALNNQLPASVMGNFKSLNGDVIINKVPLSCTETVRKSIKPGKSNISVINEDRALLSFSIADLVGAIDGQILNNSDMADMLVENFMLGAMTVDSAVPYFNLMGNKVVVIRADRPDMQSAALLTSVRAIVVSGTTPLIPLIQDRAQSKRIPIIRTTLDCSAVAGRIEDTLIKIRFHQKNKIPRMMELLQRGFDDNALHHALGI